MPETPRLAILMGGDSDRLRREAGAIPAAMVAKKDAEPQPRLGRS